MQETRKRHQREGRQFATQIGTRVQFLRLEQRLSLREVAERGKCSVSTVANVEHGIAEMTTSTLHAVAKGLGVQPFDLLNHDPDSSDVGFLLEAMRLHPKCIRLVNAKLAALA